MDKIRCPNCRGSKKVAKIGGMLGDCNTCVGTGSINAEDKPKPVIAVEDVCAKELIEKVADCVPDTIVIAKDVKIDPKRTLYKRKK